MNQSKKLMQALHIVVPEPIRDAILAQAAIEGVSAGAVARELLAEGMKARGLEVQC
jgi:hypothetical protein